MPEYTSSRVEYQPINERPAIKLPGEARMVIWPVVNVEVWDFNAPLPRTLLPYPQGIPVVPDVANYSWFEYGLRVGIWRIKDVLDELGIRATASINGVLCETHPKMVGKFVESKWELLGHNYLQQVMSKEPDERKSIRMTRELLEKASNKPMRGWMGPGLSETEYTLDILAEEGIEYVADWVNDDLPYKLNTKSGRLYALPYTLELNDIVLHLIQQRPSHELFERARDQFDTLYAESIVLPKIMCISVHPYVSGVAHRIKYFRQVFEYAKQHQGVIFMTGEEILDWYLQVSGE
ncbi:MAG: polysaccharide deacetylase family protein [Bacillota bacterium]|nr:polysaccharide deacetylase family protein [Bacillota bacterium]